MSARIMKSPEIADPFWLAVPLNELALSRYQAIEPTAADSVSLYCAPPA
ncbi:hypothetical protein [Cohnella sp. GCM10012308]